MNRPPPVRRTTLSHLANSAIALAAASLCAGPAAAADLSLSGFATAEYARSNRAYNYLRFIDEQGTFKAGSLAAVQADVRLNPQWSATLQLKAAPSLESDERVDVVPSWAFVAWRPSDEWMLRLGQMRVPLYLYSESQDIGVAHDLARLPREVYSAAPSSDFRGLFATWSSGLASDAELTIEAYHGSNPTTARFWTRDGVPGAVAPGSFFTDINVRSSGLIATWRSPTSLLRAGLHSARTSPREDRGSPVRFPFVTIAPGLGYYQVNASLPGPGVETVSTIKNTAINLGAEWRLGQGWRVAGEVSRILQHRTELGSASSSAYVALFKDLGGFTPYVSLATGRNDARQTDWYRRLRASQLPPFVPGAAQINATQRLASETAVYMLSQDTVSLGSAYSLGGHGKLKLEWARTRLGEASRLAATPPGGELPEGTKIDTWTLSYSVAF